MPEPTQPSDCRMSRRWALAGVAASAVYSRRLCAQLPRSQTIRIGILNDGSGPFADQSGLGSMMAAELAVQDFRATEPGMSCDLLYGDHQNKPDIGSAIVRQWVDREGVVAVADCPNSAVGLAVNEVMRQRNLTFVATNVATSDLSGKDCAPTTVQWTVDTWALGNAAAQAQKEQGHETWFFIQVDYALGAGIVRDATQAIERVGGKIFLSSTTGRARVVTSAPPSSRGRSRTATRC